MISGILQFIGGAITVYMVLILFRIIMTWFQGPFMPGPVQIIARVTDPYLHFFRRFSFLRMQTIDLSPIVGIIVLVIARNIVVHLSVAGRITVGLFLRIIIFAVWASCEYLLILLLVLVVIRLIGIAIRVNSTGPFWLTLDHILEPIAYKLSTVFFKQRVFTYQNGLLFTGAVLFLFWLVAGFIIMQFGFFIGRLPF